MPDAFNQMMNELMSDERGKPSSRSWANLWMRWLAALASVLYLEYCADMQSADLKDVASLFSRAAFGLFFTVFLIEAIKATCARWGKKSRLEKGKGILAELFRRLEQGGHSDKKRAKVMRSRLITILGAGPIAQVSVSADAAVLSEFIHLADDGYIELIQEADGIRHYKVHPAIVEYLAHDKATAREKKQKADASTE